jgi:CHAT domain-containing protein/tetratricopeptide (TPR) repeat protein
LSLAWTGLSPAETAIAPGGLDDCDAVVRERPDDLDAYRCYWIVARRDGSWDAAFERVEALWKADPEEPRVLFVLGGMAADRGQERAEDLYRRAADRFGEEGHVRGEVLTRVSISAYLTHRGNHEEGRVEAERALAVAETSGEPVLIGEARHRLGWQCFREHDYGGALENMKEAESLLLADGPLRLRIEVLNGLGGISWGLLRFGEALDYYERAATLAHGMDAYQEATIRRNIALTAERLRVNEQITEEELIAYQRSALDASIRSGNRFAETGTRLMLATSLRGEEGLVEAEKALELARQLRASNDLYWALWLTAEKTARLHPERSDRAIALADEAIALARDRGDPRGLATGLNVRFACRWEAGLWQEAVEDGFAALDAIERIRDLQSDTETRARVSGRFANSYYRLAAMLLGPPDQAADEARVESAVGVMERYRARVLLETMDAAGATAVLAPTGPAAEERTLVLGAIGAILSEFRGGGLTPARRDELFGELARLEERERVLRAEIALKSPSFAALRMPDAPGFAGVRSALAPDQALLYYTAFTQPQFTASLWYSRLLVVTRHHVTVYPIPDRPVLDRQIRVYRALLERRDGSEGRGAARLHDELLRDALDALPPEVTRLVIVPDGPLHRLPFGTLRAEEGASPLAARYELFMVPSVATWLRWKQDGRASIHDPILAFADPLLDETSEPDEAREGDPTPTGRLPYARKEAAAIRRFLGGDAPVLTGDDATETALKLADLASTRVLHLAAHAVVDDDYPERSAVLLAPGPGQDDDGRLEFGEVVELDLDGQVVILSACRSGSGPIVGGEGVMGLANAFFQAGARSVVAGLWAVRDRETSRLMERFGRYLGEGESIASALALARRDLIERGAPAAAWAGMVVLGDGDLVPLPGGRSGSTRPAWVYPVAALAVAATILLTWAVRRRRRAYLR